MKKEDLEWVRGKRERGKFDCRLWLCWHHSLLLLEIENEIFIDEILGVWNLFQNYPREGKWIGL